ncbi:MAG: ANTAR domain-containing protein [Eubacteriales bacterium]
MKRALVVSAVEKATEFFVETLGDINIKEIVKCRSGEEARLAMAEDSFDLVVINHPLVGEAGESLSRYAAKKAGMKVILAVKAQDYPNIAKEMTPRGIFTVSKPTNRQIFGAVLQSAQVSYFAGLAKEEEISRLRQKLEDIKIVDRAKCMLISNFSMDEQQSHRYIEKQAMDLRISRRKVAENILKAYEY